MDELDSLTKDAWELSEKIMRLCNDYTVATIGTALTFACATLAMHNENDEAGAGTEDIKRFVNGIELMGNHFIDKVYEAKSEGRDLDITTILSFEDGDETTAH